MTFRGRCYRVECRAVKQLCNCFKNNWRSAIETTTSTCLYTVKEWTTNKQQFWRDPHPILERRASNCWRDRESALVRNRHFTLSCVRHKIMQRYGTYPRQWPLPSLLPPLPLLVFPPTNRWQCSSCSCALLIKRSCSLSTLLVRKSMSVTSRMGFRSSHSNNVCALKNQLLGRGTGMMLNKFARRTMSFTYSLLWERKKDFGRRDHGSCLNENRGLLFWFIKPILIGTVPSYHFLTQCTVADTSCCLLLTGSLLQRQLTPHRHLKHHQRRCRGGQNLSLSWIILNCVWLCVGSIRIRGVFCSTCL